MLDTKKMLQDGFRKVTVAAYISKDRNGKEHIVIVDTLDHAKEYKSNSDQITQVTMYVKD